MASYRSTDISARSKPRQNITLEKLRKRHKKGVKNNLTGAIATDIVKNYILPMFEAYDRANQK